jgi:broad specificity polyphosphatase/5'/3'-nucleotidase SurE
MRRLLIAPSIIGICQCTPTPSTTIELKSPQNEPIRNFPLRVETSKGLQITNSDGEKSSMEIRTDNSGLATFSYTFKNQQPSSVQVLLSDAKAVPNQNISITPLKDLPKGSRISITIPNP